MFQSSPSGRRETGTQEERFFTQGSFNPLPPGGGRHVRPDRNGSRNLFQSSPSGRRETSYTLYLLCFVLSFNPLPPGGGRHGKGGAHRESLRVSILSLRAEGDWAISTTPATAATFQSSPSGRRETPVVLYTRVSTEVSILSLRAEGDIKWSYKRYRYGVSILSLRAEGDLFLRHPHMRQPVSILSLRAEGDPRQRRCGRAVCGFNPLPPGGGRHCGQSTTDFIGVFQSSPSGRRETCLR